MVLYKKEKIWCFALLAAADSRLLSFFVALGTHQSRHGVVTYFLLLLISFF